MAEDFGEPLAPEEGSKRNVVLIGVIIAVVVVCCCCVGAAAMYYGTEPIMEMLGIPIPW